MLRGGRGKWEEWRREGEVEGREGEGEGEREGEEEGRGGEGNGDPCLGAL